MLLLLFELHFSLPSFPVSPSFILVSLLVCRVLENVKEIWKETPSGKGKKAVTRDRVVPKMFLRGDSVIVVVSGESFKAAGGAAGAS